MAGASGLKVSQNTAQPSASRFPSFASRSAGRCGNSVPSAFPQCRSLNLFGIWAGALDVVTLAADAGGVVRLARWFRQAIAPAAGKRVGHGCLQADAVPDR